MFRFPARKRANPIARYGAGILTSFRRYARIIAEGEVQARRMLRCVFWLLADCMYSGSLLGLI